MFRYFDFSVKRFMGILLLLVLLKLLTSGSKEHAQLNEASVALVPLGTHLSPVRAQLLPRSSSPNNRISSIDTAPLRLHLPLCLSFYG